MREIIERRGGSFGIYCVCDKLRLLRLCDKLELVRMCLCCLVKCTWLINSSCAAAWEDIWSKLIKTVHCPIPLPRTSVCLWVSLYVLKYFSACLGTKAAHITVIYRVPGYICLCTYPSVSSSFLPLCVSLWSTASHCFRYFLPLCMCVYVCLWWAGRKLAVKWGDSSNVGQDWDQRDWETDPSALCKSALQNNWPFH